MTVDRRAFVTGAAASFVAAAASPARAQQTFHFKIGHNTPDGQAHSVRVKQMAAEIARETHGRLTIDVFGNAVLGTDSAMLSQTRSGALQIVLTAGAYLGAIAPIVQIDSIPFAFTSSDDAVRAFEGELGTMIRADILERSALVALPGSWDTGFRQVASGTKPIREPDDFAGFKIRVPPAKIFVDTFKTLGAAPASLNFSELYVAAQTHLVDGLESPLDFIEYSRFFEVTKYLSLTNHMWNTRWMLVNGDAWKSLPPDLQAVLGRASAKYAALAHRDTEALDTVLVDKLRRRGMIVNTTNRDAFKRKLGTAFYDRWRDAFGPKAWALLLRATGPLS
ncbi:MAG TPA: TRAP transporter substrate-binding protein [Candidatus Elarobacter sp.]|jgi:tripartite ATP-independent transporter DctP family solute receptor|nr:TRAP transporter substrate-binding protein [Candidatus Elarobacter sp.]